MVVCLPFGRVFMSRICSILFALAMPEKPMPDYPHDMDVPQDAVGKELIGHKSGPGLTGSSEGLNSKGDCLKVI